MKRHWFAYPAATVATVMAAVAAPLLAAGAQGFGAPSGFPTADSIVRKLYAEGTERSQLVPLAQALFDSIGPRLTGSPGQKSGNDWLVATYTKWGIPARNERYGTWKGWRRGITHVDLIAPRVRSLEATMLAWSPGTGGKDVTGPLVIVPEVADSNAFAQWLPQVKGKFVLVSMPQPTCRPDDDWQANAVDSSFARMRRAREAATAAWNERLRKTGYGIQLGTGALGKRLEQAGAAGVIASRWSNGWGVNKIFDTKNERVPAIDVSCEDYGLIYRLAEHNQGPVLRIRAESENLGEVPVFNTIAEIKGTEKPNEYVVLSAHFDSWDGGSGATDNGTGTLTMLEAMRILKTVYPAPKRTILVGHWSGEEQGLVGSRSFAADHPEVVRGLQALFNQDNGTGRVVNISPSGLIGAGEHWGRWASYLPGEISRYINYSFPGNPAGGGSDNASFVCYGAPAFGLGALGWQYGTYTWHTNRDTYDKVVFDDLRNNATLTAILAYLAADDPETVPRERRVITGTNPQTGRPNTWPDCQTPPRTSAQSTR
jgi:carboxypeptidase Q